MCTCDGGPEVFKAEVRRARKQHECYECRQPILKGDLYEHHSGVWDGTPAAYKWCDNCATIANLAKGVFDATHTHSSDDFCFSYGQLLDCVGEVLREVA